MIRTEAWAGAQSVAPGPSLTLVPCHPALRARLWTGVCVGSAPAWLARFPSPRRLFVPPSHCLSHGAAPLCASAALTACSRAVAVALCCRQANTGLGLETARVIGKNGGAVVMACRTPSRCELGKSKIEAEVKAGGGSVQCMKMDLGSLASVDEFVAEFLESGLKLDYLVNNAGIMALPTYQETADGVEKQWGVNHLGHFRLTTQLLEKLKETKGSRVINLSSLAHLWWTKEDTIEGMPLTESNYNDEAAYGTSKASNVMFTLGLRKRLEGSGVLTTSGHPGCIVTELGRNNQEMLDKFVAMFETMEAYFGIQPLKTIPQGSATTLMMMLDDLPASGNKSLYYSDGAPGVENGNYWDGAVANADNADALWALSEKYVADYEAKKA